jgi:hypothetical protein
MPKIPNCHIVQYLMHNPEKDIRNKWKNKVCEMQLFYIVFMDIKTIDQVEEKYNLK